jgi:hypothetical protein
VAANARRQHPSILALQEFADLGEAGVAHFQARSNELLYNFAAERQKSPLRGTRRRAATSSK